MKTITIASAARNPGFHAFRVVAPIPADWPFCTSDEGNEVGTLVYLHDQELLSEHEVEQLDGEESVLVSGLASAYTIGSPRRGELTILPDEVLEEITLEDVSKVKAADYLHPEDPEIAERLAADNIHSLQDMEDYLNNAGREYVAELEEQRTEWRGDIGMTEFIMMLGGF